MNRPISYLWAFRRSTTMIEIAHNLVYIEINAHVEKHKWSDTN